MHNDFIPVGIVHHLSDFILTTTDGLKRQIIYNVLEKS